MIRSAFVFISCVVLPAISSDMFDESRASSSSSSSQETNDLISVYYPKEVLKTNSGIILSYNVSLPNENVRVEGGVLRISITREGEGSGRVRVYDVLPDTLKVLRLLDSQETTLNGTGWVELSVSESLTRRLSGGSPSDSSNRSSTSELVYLLLSLSADESSSLPALALPSTPAIHDSMQLVVKYIDTTLGRVKRRASKKKGRKQIHRLNPEKGLCRRERLYVNFEDLGWKDWIRAPDGFEAYQCVGSCSTHPLPNAVNASNHAIVQGLMHSIVPQIPPPCCVPTSLRSLSLLYNITGRIEMKEYPQMIVEECGCR